MLCPGLPWTPSTSSWDPVSFLQPKNSGPIFFGCRRGYLCSSNSLLSRKMGFDCGFDIYPALEPTSLNKEKYELFLREVLRTYEGGDEAERCNSIVRVVPTSSGAYVEFMVGEHPIIPYSCEHFLRFSSKVSGSLTAAAEPYIKGVYKIAKKWLGDRVQFWHELNETDDHRQWVS